MHSLVARRTLALRIDKRTLVIMPIALAFFAFAVGCRQQENPLAAMMQRPAPLVSVAVVQAKDVPVYLDEIGKALTMEMVAITPQVGGKIVAAHVDDGSYVTKGQLLFEIDPRPFRAALEAAQATLSQNKADLELARVELRRVESLKETSV